MAASIPVLRALVREAAGTSRRLGWPVTYARDQSRKAISRVRSLNGLSITPGRLETADHCGDAINDDKARLNIAKTNGPILKTEEVHVEFVDRRPGDSIEIELERIPRSYSLWV